MEYLTSKQITMLLTTCITCSVEYVLYYTISRIQKERAKNEFFNLLSPAKILQKTLAEINSSANKKLKENLDSH